ncbi:MAG: 30S ribosome-binding factor RbfA [Deltaproteobacteria bacterium]|nr:30S ribosome-binding factor RbfA [Deltaproteobacteria bacterium]
MASRRPERVGDLVKQEIASMMLHGEIKDPRIGFVTITHVEMTPDLKEARVYFSQIGSDKDKEKSREGLSSASGFIRRRLAKALDLRHVPEVSFHYDASLDYGDRIDRIIKEIKEDKDRG